MNMPIHTVVSSQPSYQMLRLKQVTQQTGLSRSTIYDMMNPNSKRYDPTFPRSVQLTQATVAWLESEVNAWIESKIKQSRNL